MTIKNEFDKTPESVLEREALAQQEQPSWVDVAARTTIARAVYEQVRKELTGPIAPFDILDADTVQRLADSLKPVAQQEQPAQEPVAWYLSEDSNILGVEWSRQKPKYGRDWTPLYKTAPTQPAPDLTQDLAMMIRRLVLSVRRIAEDDSKDLSFANSCLSWLRDKGLAGSPFREDQPPTPPALSDDEILNCFYASKPEGMASYMLAVGRAVEAHCRGGK